MGPLSLAQLVALLGKPEQHTGGLDGAAACVCDLSDAFELSQPTISHHLKVLYDSGLLEREKRGVWVYYRARTQALASLGALIGSAPR